MNHALMSNGVGDYQKCNRDDDDAYKMEMKESTFNHSNELNHNNSSDDIEKKSDDLSSDSSSDRPAWDNKFQYIMAALGFAVGLGNIWRFPYLCQKNGGGAFLIPYFIMLLLEGYPLYFLELAIGQRIRKGAVGVWCCINPSFAGIGFAGIVVSLLIGLYYNMILAWALFYFQSSFRTTLPWASCPAVNGTVVHECAVSSTTSYYWYREVLDISSSIENGSDVNWMMVVVLFIAWFVVFLGIMKGIKTSGKCMYFSTLFPYIVLVAFFIRGLTLEGAAAGVRHMFKPDIGRLADPVVWREAATQIFFSLGLGYGAIVAYSSYNPINNNCRKDALFVATANSVTSVFACITVFSVLGFKAHLITNVCNERNQMKLSSAFPEMEHVKNSTNAQLLQQVAWLNETHPEIIEKYSPFEECSIEKELQSIGQGTGLAFIAFAETILNFPGAPVWAVLFFFMLLNIGMSSEFGILQGFITMVLDSGLKISKVKLTSGLCTFMFLIGLIFTMRSGSYFLDLFDTYAATFGLVTVALFETLTVSWVYKMKRFEEDIEYMIGSKPGWYWKASWMFVCPLIMFAILIASVVDLFLKTPVYGAWDSELGKKVEFPYPWWALVLIGILILSSVVCIPLVAILYRIGKFHPEKFGGTKYERNTRGEKVLDVTESAQPLTAV